MNIGEPSWQWVGLDSTGVPHGGRYGNVAWFHAGVKRLGLELAWSRMYRVFFLFRRWPNGQIQPLKAFANWDTPVAPTPFCAKELDRLRWRQHWFGRQTAGVLIERQRQGERDRMRESERVRAEVLTHGRDELLRKVLMDMGVRTRPLISVPKTLGIRNVGAN